MRLAATLMSNDCGMPLELPFAFHWNCRRHLRRHSSKLGQADAADPHARRQQLRGLFVSLMERSHCPAATYASYSVLIAFPQLLSRHVLSQHWRTCVISWIMTVSHPSRASKQIFTSVGQWVPRLQRVSPSVGGVSSGVNGGGVCPGLTGAGFP